MKTKLFVILFLLIMFNGCSDSAKRQEEQNAAIMDLCSRFEGTARANCIRDANITANGGKL